MEGSSVQLKGNNIAAPVFIDAELEIHLVFRFIEHWLESWDPDMNTNGNRNYLDCRVWLLGQPAHGSLLEDPCHGE